MFASKGRYDVAFSDLLMAVFTPVGSRPMARTFGSSLSLSLMEPITGTLQKVIEQSVRASVARHAPHIYIAGIDMLARGREVAIGIKFGLVDERNTQERTVLIPKSDLTRLIAAQYNQ
jgi:phage baseplate assembly protein W